MATTVKITETYDLKTSTGRLGLIGIHTPSSSMVSRLYPGLCKNHKYIRIQKCDVTGVCASVLPADPLQIGVEAGDVAPEDMFNPILYKPVSNESFETVLARLYRGQDIQTLGSVMTASDTEHSAPSGFDPFNTYYALLSESKHWKKAMPQNGFGLRGLFPICYQMINQYGNVGEIGRVAGTGQTTLPVTADKTITTDNYDTVYGQPLAVSFRGKSVRMPRLPLHKKTEYGKYGMGDYSETASWDATEVGDFDIPRTFVALFVIPPARLHEFYYRMRVSWTITFEGVCSVLEVGNISAYNSVAGTTYAKNFSYASSKAEMENPTDLVDTSGVSISKIMES